MREDVIPELGLTVTEMADRLGMSRVALSRVINGRAEISPNLAIRLEKAGISTARTWLMLQTNYNLAKAMKAMRRVKLSPIIQETTHEKA